MGTNIYLIKPIHMDVIFDRFDIELPRVHVGKFSVGWRFHFNGQVCRSKDDWMATIVQALKFGWRLVDEYGMNLSVEQFSQRIALSLETATQSESQEWLDRGGFYDEYSYPFSPFEFS